MTQNTQNAKQYWDGKDVVCQGDIVLMAIPKDIVLNKSIEIKPKGNSLIVAEGELTGHHHAIWNRNPPVAFRANEGEFGGKTTSAATSTVKKNDVGTAKLYTDDKAMDALVTRRILTTKALGIGFLVVEGGPVNLDHDEHATIVLPEGAYYVGGQQEQDAEALRRVAD